MAPPREKKSEDHAAATEGDGSGVENQGATQEGEGGAQTPEASDGGIAAADEVQEETSESSAAAPLERIANDGETVEFASEYLIANAHALTGYPSHVMAGALHANDKAYLSAAEAQSACKRWLGTESATEKG